MDRQSAIAVRGHLLSAISELSLATYNCYGRCSTDDYEALQTGAGRAIGRIDTLLLKLVYEAYPELDHRKPLAEAWSKFREE